MAIFRVRKSLRAIAIATVSGAVVTAFAARGAAAAVTPSSPQTQGNPESTPAPQRSPQELLSQALDALRAQRTGQGRVVTLPSVRFAEGQTAFGAADQPRLDQIVSVLHEFPKALVVVEGFTDGLLLPLFVGDLSKGGTIARRLSAATAISIIFSCIVFGVVFHYAEPLLSLLVGEQFVASAEPLRILVLSAAFAGLTAIFRFAAVALNQQARVLRADVLGVTVAIIAHIVLIPRYGLMGAAVGKLAGDLTTMACVTLILRRNLDRGILLAVAIGGALAVTLVELLDIASQIGVYWLIAAVICGAATFGVALLVPPIRKDLAMIAR